MLRIDEQPEDGIIVVEPVGALEQSDFEKLAKAIDEFAQERSPLSGLIIHTESFPGWRDFSAFTGHMRFIKRNHERIQRIAVVTDSVVGSIGPAVAGPFLSAQIKHFAYEALDEAVQWVRGAD